MKFQKLYKWSIILFVVISIGVLFSSFWGFCILGVVTAITMLLTAIGFVLDLIFKTSKFIRFTGFLFIFFLSTMLISFSTRSVHEYWYTQKGNKVVAALEECYNKRGEYPQTIDSIYLAPKEAVNIKERKAYSVDVTKQKFEYHCWSDGWHYKVYYSDKKKWELED